ncbi:unnamed protein product [Colletotrichum noveboracense]|uniref:Heterokaryon incompatibility domain-containing protein n=1 Tax=Colletotrichum noveboracense TaxID=2664923 RepID=A0A9W4RJ80_9PEZI|nr:unnamed protein product [Colletotrichum noveboracense]
MENSHKNGTLTDILEPKEAVDAVAKYAPPQDHSNGRRGAHNEGLCEDCAVLDLGVHCFKVQPGSTKPAGKPVQDQPAAIRSYTTPHHLGSLSDIRNRSSECEMCALIIDSVEEAGTQNPTGDVLDAAAEHALENAKCSISWEIDGREASRSKSRGHNPANTVRGITRRMHIRWDHPRLSDAYLVYVAPERFARTASDADRVWAKDSLFLGRKITEDIENQALIRSWLDLCQKSHRGPCRQNKDEGVERFVEMVSHSYFGVIDVQNMQLTQLPCKSRERSRDGRERRYAWGTDMHEPYVALSYVWGTDETAYTTLTDNVMLHRMHGGLEDVLLRLPKAIQDAIDLVRRLGFKYMWIDRLCIVQNSSRSWKLNAFNMDLIYGNAALTICAADGDASIGLRAMRPSTRNTKQYKRMINPHLELMVTRPPEIYIRSSEWNDRAWTFQERLLSRRCLIFTNGRVYFQCRSTGMSEDIFGDQKGAGWSLDLVDAPMQMFRQLDDRAFWVYMKCVELYTERKLTQAKDIQAAFSGMANMMEERMNAPFIHGLPSSHFDLALLWEPVRSVKRRTSSTNKNDHTIPDFPSWSWTGWIGETKYHDDLIGGALDNVSQWLNTHTWIQWWVRDGHGDLRPLWDYHQSLEDASEDHSWRGYTKKRAERSKYRLATIKSMAIANRKIGIPSDFPRRRGSPSPVQRDGSPGGSSYSDDSASYSDVDVRLRERAGSRSRSRQGAPRSRDDKPLYQGYTEATSYRQPAAFRASNPVGRTYSVEGRSRIPVVADDRDRDRRSRHEYEDRLKLPPHSPSSPKYDQRRKVTREGALFGAGPVVSGGLVSAPAPVHTADFFDMFFEDNEKEFSITLRDYPYRVVKAPFEPKPETSEFPLLPILQFRTWHTWLYIKHNGPSERQFHDRKLLSMGTESGLARYHIADEMGDWCGSVVLEAEWAAKASDKQEFIAISEAKSFTRDECPEWTYYIPKEREQSEWDLFYVLLIERKDEKWERVGVGKAFKEAFHNSKQKEIMLS